MFCYLNNWFKLFFEEYSGMMLVCPISSNKSLELLGIPSCPDSTTSTIVNYNNINNKPHLTIRNNKIVYSLSKKGNKLSLVEANAAKDKFKRGKRGSKYRGVSRNGNQWQVLIMINKKKKYMGNYSFEEKAARVYDKIAIQYHGGKAKTNFLYSKNEIAAIITKNEY